MRDQASPQIKQAFDHTITQQLSGKYSGSVLLTPSSVNRVTRATWEDRNFLRWPNWKPDPLVPRYEFTVDPSSGSVTLYTGAWTLGGRTKVIGIYQGGLKFPEFCCKCMKPVTRYELVELGLSKQVVSFKSYDLTPEKAALVAQALAYDRFWYAVPFCKEHGLESKAVTFEEDNSIDKVMLGFTNQEYGRLFGEFNRLEGRWMTQSKLLVRMLSIVSAFAGIGLVGAGGLWVYQGLQAEASGKLVRGLVLLLIGMGGLGVWRLTLRWWRGE